MGSITSGRYQNYQRKAVVDNREEIDIRRWQKIGFLDKPGKLFRTYWFKANQQSEDLMLEVGGTKTEKTVYLRCNGQPTRWPITLATTKCGYGRRYWFVCPVSECHRRVAKLYKENGSILACRHCFNLTYACRNENLYSRLRRKRQKILTKLGCSISPEGGLLSKPRYMHFQTFERLLINDCNLELRLKEELEAWAKRIM